MSRIFISYRRADSEIVVGRIYDHLRRHFGKSNVFKDVDSLSLGVDFREAILRAVASCDVIVAVIGPGWLDARNERGERRLENSDDFVRLELEAALARDAPLIPLFVGNTPRPQETELPKSLSALAFRNGISIRPDPDFANDITRLITAIEVPKQRNPPRLYGLAAALLLVLSIGVWQVWKKSQPVPPLTIPPTTTQAPRSIASTVNPQTQTENTQSSPPITTESVATAKTTRADIEPPAGKRTIESPVVTDGPITVRRDAPRGEDTGVQFNDAIVWDARAKLAVVRNLYLMGNSKALFSRSTAGTATPGQDLDAIDDKAKAVNVGGLTGWHVASAQELAAIQRLEASAVFDAFTSVRRGYLSNVIGVYRGADGAIETWGYQYANHLKGPYEKQLYQGNEFGVWLVASCIVRPGGPSAFQSLRSRPEVHTEASLQPLFVRRLNKKDNDITAQPSAHDEGYCGTLGGEEARSIAHYGLKPLGRGALVRAELVMEPISASGTGQVFVNLYETDGNFRPTETGDWAPRSLNPEELFQITWNGRAAMRFTLPEHVMRNLFNGGEWMGVSFRYAGNGDARFKSPTLIVTYVKESDLLIPQQ